MTDLAAISPESVLLDVLERLELDGKPVWFVQVPDGSSHLVPEGAIDDESQVARAILDALSKKRYALLADTPSVEPLAGALAILDVIDGIVDDTHPEGDGCPLCAALDELRDILGGTTR